MNDPQIWTFIAVFSALIFASNRQLTTSIRRELDSRFSENEARMDQMETRLEARMDQGFARLDAKIDGVEARLDAKIDAVEARLDARIDRLETKMDAGFTDVDHRLGSLESDMHLVKGHLIGRTVPTPVRG